MIRLRERSVCDITLLLYGGVYFYTYDIVCIYVSLA